MKDWSSVLDMISIGDLDGAHKLVQDDPSPEAAYLHGMIHREEGDLGNARYWFARSGDVAARLGVEPMGVERSAERDALRRLLGA